MTPPETLTAHPLTEETLKDLEELVDKGTPGKWEADPVRIGVTDKIKEGVRRIWTRQKPHMSSDIIILEVETEDADLICGLRNHAAELLRLAKVGIATESAINGAE